MIPDGLLLPQPSQPSLSEVVLKILREMISAGQFKPGQHLKEAELATALKVSRGPVREALTQLEAEGHVELRRHRGAFVSTLTRVDVEEVHTLRTAIERLAAERACTRMGEPEFAAMDAVLEKMKAATRPVKPEDAVRLDLQFHDIIYAACDHQRVQRVWTSIRSQVSFFLHTRNVNFPDFTDVGYPEHLELRNALSQADPAAACAAVEKHLSGAYERLKKLDLPDKPV
ncbi:MAG: transcriptional regulator, GntR family [Propionibacteriaceae bacterium]|jgi:DNA-binding GntR family transcriptional regulator|nr:transcriptional regulator, GntR family [Propionibacteriaceae bacterium]